MIRPLRRRHRRFVTLLAVLVPLVFVAALAVRSPVPQTDRLPAALSPEHPDNGSLVVQGNDLFSEIEVTVRLYEVSDGRRLIQLQAVKDTTRPDLLAYWSPSEPGGAKLPEDSTLLGSIAAREARTYGLPGGATPGFLVAYSLGHQEVVDWTELPAALRAR